MTPERKPLNREEMLLKMGRTIFHATMETLENLAFMEVLEAGNLPPEMEKPPPLQPDACLWVSLLVHDPVQGEFRLIMPRTLIVKMADAIYASDQISDKLLYDTMGEILNTIAGRFMNEFLDPDRTFQLGLPESGEGKPPVPEEAISKTWDFVCENESFEITVMGESLLKMRRKEDYE